VEQGKAASREQQTGGLGFAAGIGALAGLSLQAHRRASRRALGAAVGAGLLVVSEAVARRKQRPGQIPPLWHRIVWSGALAAPLGWALERASGAGPVAVGTGAGALAGAMGLRPQKVALGPVFGAAVGRALAAVDRRIPAPVVAACTVVAYRVVSAATFRDTQVALLADRVSA
jgi:hypothetical protein